MNGGLLVYGSYNIRRRNSRCQHQIIDRPHHEQLAQGEYESQKELAKYLPANSVKPVAHGPLSRGASSALGPAASFFLAQFLNFADSARAPTPEQLADVLARLHTSSTSPNGKFGFHVPTFYGHVPLLNDWCDTWEEYFTRQLRADLAWEATIRGFDDHELNDLSTEFLDKIVPRLIRQLETGGRSIKPVLVHGDLWVGNVGIVGPSSAAGDGAALGEQKIVLFDACCCYAHHECESPRALEHNSVLFPNVFSCQPGFSDLFEFFFTNN
ncbi:protein-ribulosamine 3-kinase [Microdochium nivale]|nr:protein-ribulosamine 3-kinase [Microdochium nivale]